MKRDRKWLILILLLGVLTLLSSCGGTFTFSKLSDDSDSDVFCRTLIDHVIADEKDEAYEMLASVGSRSDFDKLWTYFRSSADGATTADIHTTDFSFFTDQETDYFKGQYFVQFDNGSDMNLSLIFEEGKSICGINYLDVTGFYPGAKKAADILSPILSIYSLLVFAFSVWMIVDCIRRYMRKKVLWILLIIVGVSLTLRVGEYNSFHIMIGLFVKNSSAWVDFGYLAVGTKIILPVGAIIYFFLRKRMTLEPLSSVSEPQMPASTETPMGDSPETSVSGETSNDEYS